MTAQIQTITISGSVCRSIGATFLLLPLVFLAFWFWWLFVNLSPYSRQRRAYVTNDGEWCVIRRIAKPSGTAPDELHKLRAERFEDSMTNEVAQPAAQLYFGCRVTHPSRGNGVVYDVDPDDRRKKPWRVRFASETRKGKKTDRPTTSQKAKERGGHITLSSHRYSAESILRKIRILQDDDISSQFDRVSDPQRQLKMGHQVLSSIRGRGTVVKLGGPVAESGKDGKGIEIMFVGVPGGTKSAGRICKLSNDEVIASIRYRPVGMKPPGQVIAHGDRALIVW